MTTRGAAWDNVFTTAVILGTLGINLIGSRIVDRAQTAIVLTELAVFAVFIVATLTSVDWSLLSFSGYPPFSDIVASVALTFLCPPGEIEMSARCRRPRVTSVC